MNCSKCERDLENIWYKKYQEWFFCQDCEKIINDEVLKLVSTHVITKIQPERSKREDYAYCIICETYSREPEKGAGHYCHKCKEYDYA